MLFLAAIIIIFSTIIENTVLTFYFIFFVFILYSFFVNRHIFKITNSNNYYFLVALPLTKLIHSKLFMHNLLASRMVYLLLCKISVHKFLFLNFTNYLKS